MQQPDLAAHCARILASVDGSLSANDRALLRARKLEALPALYGDILRRLPNDASLDAWMPIVHALGSLRHNVRDTLSEEQKRALYVRSAARLLGEIGYSDVRMSRLLNAHGRSLILAAEDALQRLVSERSGACRMTDLAVLVVADALKDKEAYIWAKRRVAMDYSRGLDLRNHAD